MMKVFNQEINNCGDCKFKDSEYMFCKYLDEEHLGGWEDEKDEIKFNEHSEIHPNCPFNKTVPHEDIENLGFLFNPRLNKYQAKTEVETYYLNFPNDTRCIISKLQIGKGYVGVLFSGIISSRPHLEFILQSLNIKK